MIKLTYPLFPLASLIISTLFNYTSLRSICATELLCSISYIICILCDSAIINQINCVANKQNIQRLQLLCFLFLGIYYVVISSERLLGFLVVLYMYYNIFPLYATLSNFSSWWTQVYICNSIINNIAVYSGRTFQLAHVLFIRTPYQVFKIYNFDNK